MKQLFIALFLISTHLLCGEANESKEAFNVTFDLPFYTVSGKVCTTTRTKNFAEESIAMTDETCRPKVNIAPQSVASGDSSVSVRRPHCSLLMSMPLPPPRRISSPST